MQNLCLDPVRRSCLCQPAFHHDISEMLVSFCASLNVTAIAWNGRLLIGISCAPAMV